MRGIMLRSPTRRPVESRRQKALRSPGRVAKIDKALAAGPDRSDEQAAAGKRLRDEGERLQKTGGHSQSMDSLAKAMEILRRTKLTILWINGKIVMYSLR